jgi:hypothetical protein
MFRVGLEHVGGVTVSFPQTKNVSSYSSAVFISLWDLITLPVSMLYCMLKNELDELGRELSWLS